MNDSQDGPRLVKKVVRSDKMRQNFIGKSQVRS
jgi:hypothetical protein